MVQPTNTSMACVSMLEHLPLSKPQDRSLKFDIFSAEDYVDLGRTILYIKAKIVMADDKASAHME